MTLDDVFGGEGLLSRTLSGFAYRDSQLQMAHAVTSALADQKHLVVEAGTGTGKTFAYLVPIFLTEKKTVISTGTRNLQDQLFFRDIPLVKKALASPKRVALLKGRANYLCHYRLEQLESGERLLPRSEAACVPAVSAWKSQTKSGDIAELRDVAEDSLVWREVTSTIDNCLGQDCPFIKDCFVLKARRAAMAADVIVVNHHLFLSDLALQEEGFGELLPAMDAVVFDEAHELPDLLSQFFSVRLSGRQLNDLARDGLIETAAACPELPELPDSFRILQAQTRALRASFGEEIRRALWPNPTPAALEDAINQLAILLQTLADTLKPVAARSKGLEAVFERVKKISSHLRQITDPTETDGAIRWFETYQQGFTLQRTPLVVAEAFKPFLTLSQKVCIFTSATLSVARCFRAFAGALGLENASKLQLDSPFNYREQAVLYVPRGLPDPRKAHYTEALMRAVLPLLELTQGRAFLLFTGYRALDEAALFLSQETNYTLLVQGTLPKKILLDQFVSLPRTILLGTAGFWQGVDVRGEALSCVVIDRLPFAPPDDPVLQARMQRKRAQGLDPFRDCQLPDAVLALKQGSGRLIRDTQDRGVLMIGDPRLVGARYGQSFLQSLPPMTRTREFETVKAFLDKK